MLWWLSRLSAQVLAHHPNMLCNPGRFSTEMTDACRRPPRTTDACRHSRWKQGVVGSRCGDNGPPHHPSHDLCAKHHNPCPYPCPCPRARHRRSPSNANTCSTHLPGNPHKLCMASTLCHILGNLHHLASGPKVWWLAALAQRLAPRVPLWDPLAAQW